jgi:thioredoxin
MNKFLYLLFSALIAFGCKGQSGEVENISPKVFAEKTKQDVQILDVRTTEEFTPQHLNQAKHIDWNAPDFEKQTAKLDKSKPVLVYCLSGGRSAKAASKLQSMGFKEVYNLDGGIVKWNAEGLPTEKEKTAASKGMTISDFNKLLISDKKVLVDFYAEWCGPCKKMAPFLEKMEKELKDELVIIRIDADKHPQLVDGLKVDALPTLILYENQKETWKHIGFISENDLKKQL